jgi:hypothetical protein
MVEYDLLLWVACQRSREVCGKAQPDFLAQELCILDADLHRYAKISSEVTGVKASWFCTFCGVADIVEVCASFIPDVDWYEQSCT